MEQITRDKLLLYHLFTGDDKVIAEEINQLSKSDWDGVIQQSIYHRVTPLIYHRLKDSSSCLNAPSEVMERLRVLYLSSAEYNMRLFRQLSKILRAFKNDGIPVIVEKGVALAELIYKNIALRPMSDIDLLVKGRDAKKVYKILLQFGYKPIEFLLSKRHMRWSHLAYKNGNNTKVEIHPDIIYEIPKLDPWIKAIPAKIESTDVFVLGAEDLFLHICLHIHFHIGSAFSKLVWWYDIKKILKHYQGKLDWDYIIKTVKESKVEEPTHSVLRAFNNWFGGDIPLDVLNQLKDDGVNISIEDFLHSYYEPDTREESQIKKRSLDLSLAYISRIPSFHNKMYHFFRSVLPSREYMMYHYSLERPSLVYFYYFVRLSAGITKIFKLLSRYLHHLKK